MKPLPNLLSYCASKAGVIRPSRDTAAILTTSDRDGELTSVCDEFVSIAGWLSAHSNFSTSTAGMRMSLPSRKPASSSE